MFHFQKVGSEMKTDLLFYFLRCLVKFPAREANSFTIKRTHSNKQGICEDTRKGRKETAVRFTRFLNYRLMFDSGLSFSLKYDLIRPPYFRTLVERDVGLATNLGIIKIKILLLLHLAF